VEGVAARGKENRIALLFLHEDLNEQDLVRSVQGGEAADSQHPRRMLRMFVSGL